MKVFYVYLGFERFHSSIMERDPEFTKIFIKNFSWLFFNTKCVVLFPDTSLDHFEKKKKIQGIPQGNFLLFYVEK